MRIHKDNKIEEEKINIYKWVENNERNYIQVRRSIEEEEEEVALNAITHLLYPRPIHFAISKSQSGAESLLSDNIWSRNKYM